MLKYIVENLQDLREDIDATLSYMYKYRMPFSQADRGDRISEAIYSAISDYEVDNDYETDEILDQLLADKDLDDIFWDATAKLDESLVTKYGNNKLNEAAKSLWFGIPDIYMIYYGEWSDPEIEYDGCVANYWEVENAMYDFMKECIADGEDWGDADNDDDFAKFCKEHVADIKMYITEMSDCDELDECNESVDEGYETVQWQHFDNDIKRYDAYVLVDNSDGAVIGNYTVYPGDFWKTILNDAIEDAQYEASNNKYGSYSVYGCDNNEYDDNTLIFSTDENVNEAFFNKFKRSPYDDKKDRSMFVSQPLKDDVSLYDIRQRIEEIIRNCNADDVAIAKKQAMRLYKFVDAMINQGFYVG